MNGEGAEEEEEEDHQPGPKEAWRQTYFEPRQISQTLPIFTTSRIDQIKPFFSLGSKNICTNSMAHERYEVDNEFSR
jgi:hypothetical protein